jgi:cytochrome b
METNAQDAITADGAKPSAVAETVPVWDRFIRIFHWSVLALFATAYLTRETYEAVHIAAGYAITALLVMRIIWGLIGSQHARFSDFIYRPAVVMRFLWATVRMRAKRYIGHNPAGGAMVIALILALLTICISGVLMTMDRFWGQKWPEEIHKVSTYATLGLIALHIVGVIFASVEHRENLVKSMFTGRKRR